MAKAKTKAHTRYRLKPNEDYPKGQIVPGVTTIIDSQSGWNKRTLISWARKEALAGNDPDKILEEAGNVGTCTHYLIQCHINGVKPDLSGFTSDQIEKAETGFLAFLEWEKGAQLTYEHIELPVVSEKYCYGGTIDMIARKDGELWLCDIKTSRSIYSEHIIQLAAYYRAYVEQEQKQLHKFLLLHIGKNDGSFAAHQIAGPKIATAWEVFEHLRALYDLEREMK